MVWWYNLLWSWSQFIKDYSSWLVSEIVDKLPVYLPADQVSRYILYAVLIWWICWLLFGFIFQTKEKDD